LVYFEIIQVSVPIDQKSSLDENRMERDDKNSSQYEEKIHNKSKKILDDFLC